MSSKPYLIALAEDNIKDQETFKKAIKEAKFKSKVKMFDNGEKIMEFLNSEMVLPEVIFLDINMPKKNGIECLKEIRGNEHFKDLIIVMFSSIALKEKIEEAFYNGANIFLLKSNDVDLLYAAVQKIVLYTHLFSSPPFSLENFIMKVD